jgi:hypothetical protein
MMSSCHARSEPLPRLERKSGTKHEGKVADRSIGQFGKAKKVPPTQVAPNYRRVYSVQREIARTGPPAEDLSRHGAYS